MLIYKKAIADWFARNNALEPGWLELIILGPNIQILTLKMFSNWIAFGLDSSNFDHHCI